MSDRFQVDLAGMVDLFSRHLYSGTQVYLRELIQNAVDAVTARGELDPAAPAQIRLNPYLENGRAVLEITDTGIGLTGAEAAELLATIGRSSKKDSDLGVGRREFIGQFGIGMLAAFMVADHIEVRSRSAQDGSLPIEWIGRANGTFDITEYQTGREDSPIGTTVRITARRDAEHWVSSETVLALALEYGSLLPFDVAVQVPSDSPTPLWRRITQPELPWQVNHSSPKERERALADYCERTFGFTPLGQIDLELPVAGLSGVAFILPQAVSPGSGQHRVYLKRMLLGSRIDTVLPEWAFFIRAVIDTDSLSPTASREQLQEDELLLGVREALGTQIKQWALRELREPSKFARNFIQTHHLALRALALNDSEMLNLVAEILPFETTDGAMTLSEVNEMGEIVYTTTTQAYRRVAAVARAQGLIVVNAGYVYDADLMARLGNRDGWQARELESSDLVQVLGIPSLERELELASVVARARQLLEDDDCDVIVRTFSPLSLPSILLRDSEGEHRRVLDRERNASPGLWQGLLDSFAGDGQQKTRTLVLNDDSSVVQRLLSAPAGEVFAAGLKSLYLSAVMMAGEGLRSAESASLADSLRVLLDSALNPTAFPTDPEQR